MITISGTLQAAAAADCRSPIFDVEVMQKRIDLKNAAITPSYIVHRVVESGSYWIVTAYNSANNTIYSRRISTLLSTDWESGWVTVASGLPSAKVHDIFVSGSSASLFYYDLGASNEPELWLISTSNSGASWGAPSLVRDAGYSSSWEILAVAATGAVTVWWAAGADGDAAILTYSYFTASTWYHDDFDDKISSETFDFGASLDMRQMFARSETDIPYTEAIMFNSAKGFIAGDVWDGVFVMHNHTQYSSIAPVRTALGCLETDLDYKFALRGLSHDSFGDGWYIGGMLETYNKAAGKFGEVSADEFFLCRTKNGLSYQLIPIPLHTPHPLFLDPVRESLYVAGVVEDSDGTIIIAITNTERGNSAIFYTDPGWLTGYDTWTSIGEDVVGEISISRSLREIASSKIVLSNGNDTYTNNNMVVEGNMIRVSAGYKTGSGDELQDRFTGEIVTVNHTFPPDKTTTLNVYDALYPARLKAGRVHVLVGHNRFRANFATQDHDKMMVHQAGVWAIASNKLQQTELGLNTFTICGYDPSDSYSVVAMVRADTSIADVKMGVVVGYDPAELTSTMYTVVCYNETTDDLEYGYVNSSGVYNLVSTLVSSLGWSADTDYYIRVDRVHGHARRALYKTSAAGAWTAVDIDEVEGMGLRTYPGLFCYVPAGGTGVSFTRVLVASNNAPLSGSDAMKYFATTCGLDTDEKLRIEDEFSGSSFGDDWELGPDGEWVISSGIARGEGTLADPAEACVTTFSASDVIAVAYMNARSGTNYSGVCVRSNCNNYRYEALIAANGYQIAKVVDDSRTILDYESTTDLFDTAPLHRVEFVANGPWLSLFINGFLYGFAYDTAIVDGYVGIVAACADGYESMHESFLVDGFCAPLPGVITINPKDSFIDAMNQVADLTPSGQFFCNELGQLRWGMFSEDSDSDLDVEDVVVEKELVRGLDKVITVESLTGSLLYANARVSPWAIRLSRHIFDGTDNKYIQSRQEAFSVATEDVLKSYRIGETDLEIRANPALEPGDIIVVRNGTVYLHDTFTDDDSTDLEDHTPDIDLAGNGWVAPDPDNQFAITDNAAIKVAGAYDCINTIDIEVTDFVLEADIQTGWPTLGGVGYPIIGFRMSDYDNGLAITLYDGMLLGFLSSGTVFEQDVNDIDWSYWDNTYIHIKIICVGPNVICSYRSGDGYERLVYSSALPAAGSDTLLALIVTTAEGGMKVDNLIVYEPDETCQIAALDETIGQAYNMRIPGLVGRKEYW